MNAITIKIVGCDLQNETIDLPEGLYSLDMSDNENYSDMLSIPDSATELNISNTSYSRIESGKSDISFNRLLQIAQILKVPVSLLVQDSNTMELTALASDIAQIKADVMLIKQSVVA